MTNKSSMLLLLAALLLTATVSAPASGGRENAPAEETAALSLLVISAASAGGSSAASLSTRLPMEIPPYLWNDFTVTDQRVETAADSRYREAGGMGVRRERLGELDLERIELRVAWPRGPRAKPTIVRVSFELGALLGADGAVLLQPGQFALLEGIRQSGRKSGQARVGSIERSGARGFVAEVMVR